MSGERERWSRGWNTPSSKYASWNTLQVPVCPKHKLSLVHHSPCVCVQQGIDKYVVEDTEEAKAQTDLYPRPLHVLEGPQIGRASCRERV